MHRFKLLLSLFLLALTLGIQAQSTKDSLPWKNGKLQVSAEGRYLQHANGTPFFWLADTGWLLPERLNRDETEYYLEQCRLQGYNLVQVQTVNGVPAMNAYGHSSHPFGYDFGQIERPGVYGYWDHMDYIISAAERRGIYIGMVCIWGGLVKAGLMDIEQAKAYGTFLANRYKSRPNIVWIIGGDIKGDVKQEVWETLATTIHSLDPNHLMTFHPRGRTLSATWFHNADWLDFNMFQSGHRRYGQRMGDGEYPIEENTEEDNWRFVERSLALKPLKPVLDGEPSYEEIPQGLHNPAERRWNADDARRYAYWSVFAGACGHTYGHNSIMQFYRPGMNAAYGATTPWYEALQAPGFRQMKYLKQLMLTFPYFERVPDQHIIAGENGQRYDRLIATRGHDYLLVYNYTARSMSIDLRRISGKQKDLWWMNPQDGTFTYIGRVNDGIHTLQPDCPYAAGQDRVLIATDSRSQYLTTGESR